MCLFLCPYLCVCVCACVPVCLYSCVFYYLLSCLLSCLLALLCFALLCFALLCFALPCLLACMFSFVCLRFLVCAVGVACVVLSLCPFADALASTQIDRHRSPAILQCSESGWPERCARAFAARTGAVPHRARRSPDHVAPGTVCQFFGNPSGDGHVLQLPCNFLALLLQGEPQDKASGSVAHLLLNFSLHSWPWWEAARDAFFSSR